MKATQLGALLVEIEQVVDANKATLDYTRIFETLGYFNSSINSCCNPPRYGYNDDWPNTKVP
jgi:hypothetical protein